MVNRFILNEVSYFGPGARKELPTVVASRGWKKALVVTETPNIDTVTVSRSSIGYAVKLESEADIERYAADIKEKLKELLNGHDVLHII